MGRHSAALDHDHTLTTLRISVQPPGLAFEFLHDLQRFGDGLNEHGKLVAPSLEDFRHGRIVFQERKQKYIGEMLDLLVQDSVLDHALKRTAALFDSQCYFTPLDELDHDLLVQRAALGNPCSESDFVQDQVRNTLKFPDPGLAAAVRGRRAAEKLGRYASKGKLLGLGAEKAATLREHPTPCAELWKRMQAESEGASTRP